MIRVEAHPQQATAYQYLPETADALSKLVLPTGPVTVQVADEMNRIPSRCYVPTPWGTAILEEGDWIVVYDVGIVSVYSAAQYPLLFEMVMEEAVPEELNPGAHAETYGKAYSDQGARALSETMLFGLDLGVEDAGPAKLFSLNEDTLEVSVAVPVPEKVPVMRFRATEDASSWAPSFEAYCVRYRLDYIVDSGGEGLFYRVLVVATGNEILQFGLGALIDCYADGELRVVNEA